MVGKIVDILLIAFKLLGELPAIFDKLQTYKKDKKFKDTVAARNQAYRDFLKAPTKAEKLKILKGLK